MSGRNVKNIEGYVVANFETDRSQVVFEILKNHFVTAVEVDIQRRQHYAKRLLYRVVSNGQINGDSKLDKTYTLVFKREKFLRTKTYPRIKTEIESHPTLIRCIDI